MTGLCDPVRRPAGPEPPATGTPPPAEPGTEPLLAEDVTICGSPVMAQVIARTTKTPVASAAAGRSQRYPPIRSAPGRNSRAAACKAARAAVPADRRLRTKLPSPAGPASSAMCQPEGSCCRARIRERIWSSPSAPGSTESAAMHSARRSAPSRSRCQGSEWRMTHSPVPGGELPWLATDGGERVLHDFLRGRCVMDQQDCKADQGAVMGAAQFSDRSVGVGHAGVRLCRDRPQNGASHQDVGPAQGTR